MRQHDAIDLMKLYSHGNFKKWNEMLAECLSKKDINRLATIRYQIQAGMDDLAKNKLNSPEMNDWFCRLVRSIDNTAKSIIRIKIPMPGDNPLLAKFHMDKHEAKKKRDKELARYLQLSSY